MGIVRRMGQIIMSQNWTELFRKKGSYGYGTMGKC